MTIKGFLHLITFTYASFPPDAYAIFKPSKLGNCYSKGAKHPLFPKTEIRI